MLYWKISNDKILKYDAIYNKEDLSDMRKKVIDNCSEIFHCENQSSNRINYNAEKIRNYRCESNNRKRLDGTFESIYYESYDEYVFPQLANYLYTLISDGTTLEEKQNAIDSIFGNICESITSNYEEQIIRLKREIDNLHRMDYIVKMKKIQKLNALTKHYEINKNQKPVSIYYEKVRSMIYLNYIGSVPIDKVINEKEKKLDIINYHRYSNNRISKR